MTDPFQAIRPAAALVLLISLTTSVGAAAVASANDQAAKETVAGRDQSVMVDARIVGDDNRTRFVADLSAPVEIGVFTLADPYRLVLDLPQVQFTLPDGIGETGRGMFSAFRYGQISPGKSRVVLDTTGPVTVDKSYVLPSTNDQPARLVVDVVPATRSEFLAASRAYREERNARAEADKSPKLAPLPDSGTGKTMIVIDPGHGGIDSGATGRTGALEKDITLEFSQLLGEKLQETELFDVEFTRTDDTFVALGERVDIARSHGARLFVSIHANSFRSRRVRGTVIYTVSDGASDNMAAEIAESENQSDILAGLDIDENDSDDVADILIDLTRRETRNFGVVFARNLVEELGKTTKMFKKTSPAGGFPGPRGT